MSRVFYCHVTVIYLSSAISIITMRRQFLIQQHIRYDKISTTPVQISCHFPIFPSILGGGGGWGGVGLGVGGVKESVGGKGEKFRESGKSDKCCNDRL